MGTSTRYYFNHNRETEDENQSHKKTVSIISDNINNTVGDGAENV